VPCKITEFQKIADSFIFVIDSLFKDIEPEKVKGIRASNFLKSMAKQQEAKQLQLQVGYTKNNSFCYLNIFFCRMIIISHLLLCNYIFECMKSWISSGTDY
jgi:hypothetical protein